MTIEGPGNKLHLDEVVQATLFNAGEADEDSLLVGIFPDLASFSIGKQWVAKGRLSISITKQELREPA